MKKVTKKDNFFSTKTMGQTVRSHFSSRILKFNHQNEYFCHFLTFHITKVFPGQKTTLFLQSKTKADEPNETDRKTHTHC